MQTEIISKVQNYQEEEYIKEMLIDTEEESTKLEKSKK